MKQAQDKLNELTNKVEQLEKEASWLAEKLAAACANSVCGTCPIDKNDCCLPNASGLTWRRKAADRVRLRRQRGG